MITVTNSLNKHGYKEKDFQFSVARLSSFNYLIYALKKINYLDNTNNILIYNRLNYKTFIAAQKIKSSPDYLSE